MEEKIIDYINEVAKLYKKVGTERENTPAKKEAQKELDAYIGKYGNKQATYKDIENSFVYLLDTCVTILNAYNKASDSKLMVFANLLKGTNQITNSTYESLIKQFNAINRDYHVAEEDMK